MVSMMLPTGNKARKFTYFKNIPRYFFKVFLFFPAVDFHYSPGFFLDESEESSDLLDSHLTRELVGSLKDDLECLNLQRVEMAFSNVLEQIIVMSNCRSDWLNTALL